jgi:hypothetical protein
MNHHEIEQQEIIERYVRHQLPDAERRAFQEHYFACDQCFAAVESTAQFIAGVQHSSRVGVLAQAAPSPHAIASESSWWANWFKPAFAAAAVACVLLAATLGWIVFKQIPQLQAEIAQERQAREAAEQRTGQTQQSTKEELEKERLRAESEKKKREELEGQIARHQTPSPVPLRTSTDTRANVPVVILESTRDSQSGTNFKLPADAKSLTLWVEVEAGNRYDGFQMQIFAANGRAVRTINGLKANSYGALAASVSTQHLPAGKYLVKLFGLKDQQKELVGDYDLMLRP